MGDVGVLVPSSSGRPVSLKRGGRFVMPRHRDRGGEVVFSSPLGPEDGSRVTVLYGVWGETHRTLVRLPPPEPEGGGGPPLFR